MIMTFLFLYHQTTSVTLPTHTISICMFIMSQDLNTEYIQDYYIPTMKFYRFNLREVHILQYE